MKIVATRTERSYALIATFQEGFAAGWKMAVPEAFRDALDIKWTPRTEGGVQALELTQGELFDFQKGDTIHDTALAYSDWSSALKTMRLSVQVIEAVPSAYTTYSTIQVIEGPVEVMTTSAKGKPKEETVDEFIVERQRLQHGRLTFEVHRPKSDKSGLEKAERYSCTQQEFVAFLRTGIVRVGAGKQVDLFEDE